MSSTSIESVDLFLLTRSKAMAKIYFGTNASSGLVYYYFLPSSLGFLIELCINESRHLQILLTQKIYYERNSPGLTESAVTSQWVRMVELLSAVHERTGRILFQFGW